MKQQENNFSYKSILQVGVWEILLNDLNLDHWADLAYKTKTNDSGVKVSNTGYHSNPNLHTHPPFYPLVDLINKSLLQITNHPNTIINEMWVNISTFGDFNHPHNHSIDNNQNSLSGVLYLKTPLNCGNIQFQNPLNLSSSTTFLPKEKSMLIFPKILFHYVEPNLSQEDRISIAFNFN
mgnify:CR=1 FL=1